MAKKTPQSAQAVREAAYANFVPGSIRRPTNHAYGSYYDGNSNISVRAPMDRSVYEYMRPNESVPVPRTQEDYRAIMKLCKSAYERVGVIHSVVDMMSEFGAEGVEIIHEDEEPNNFYKAWSKKVQLEDRVERFLSWLYKGGNVVVRRSFANLKGSDLRKINKEIMEVKPNADSGRIPISYTLYDPSTIELVGGSIGALSDRRIYALRVPLYFTDGIRTPKNDLEKEVYNALPKEIKDAIEGKVSGSDGIMYLKIPQDKLYIAHFKKDDSDIWGKSFIYSILEDVFYNDKLKLAKTAALDGWANVVRLWKMGDHTSNLPPAPDDFNKLRQILEANVGGGAYDIIWHSALTLEEHYPPIENLANLEENMHNILLGLGVPEGLVGGKAEGSSGMTNNILGLKNLIKRLEAGRRAVEYWLQAEIDIIHKEMGFKKKPTIRFAHADLWDERTYFNLLIQLVDRNILSDQTILERINESPLIEMARISREQDMRESGKLPDKASPFHKPDVEETQKFEMDKIKLQNQTKPKNIHPSGRPSGVKDSVKRKRGPNKIKINKAKLIIEAGRIYDWLDNQFKKTALEVYNVNDFRSLTSEQYEEWDQTRNSIFASIEPFRELDLATAFAEAQDIDSPIELYESTYGELLSDLEIEAIDNNTKRLLRIEAYALTWLNVFGV